MNDSIIIFGFALLVPILYLTRKYWVREVTCPACGCKWGQTGIDKTPKHFFAFGAYRCPECKHKFEDDDSDQSKIDDANVRLSSKLLIQETYMNMGFWSIMVGSAAIIVLSSTLKSYSSPFFSWSILVTLFLLAYFLLNHIVLPRYEQKLIDAVNNGALSVDIFVTPGTTGERLRIFLSNEEKAKWTGSFTPPSNYQFSSDQNRRISASIYVNPKTHLPELLYWKDELVRLKNVKKAQLQSL